MHFKPNEINDEITIDLNNAFIRTKRTLNDASDSEDNFDSDVNGDNTQGEGDGKGTEAEALNSIKELTPAVMEALEGIGSNPANYHRVSSPP